MSEKEKNRVKNTSNDVQKKNEILKSYDCSGRCRVCPFPGAKCNSSSWK